MLVFAPVTNFNPRSPYGERPNPLFSSFPTADFNPRSPYGERLQTLRSSFKISAFQSTLPLRGATCINCLCFEVYSISIHAPLTGSDCSAGSWTSATRYFNPRSPYGERHQRHSIGQIADQFQSTLPLRGATAEYAKLCKAWPISIHAPLTGSDDYN